MTKSKTWLVGLMVAMATGLPSPSAEASELVKLGKLLITGKRAPSTEPGKAAQPQPAAPAARQPDGGAESRQPNRISLEGAGGELPAVEWNEPRPSEAANPRSSPPPANPEPPRAGGERVGRSPAPQQQFQPLA